LRALAEPGAVVIAAATRRLVGDFFEYRDLGNIELKGITGPVPAWQVLRLSAVESPFAGTDGSPLALSRSLLMTLQKQRRHIVRQWSE
jgi:hypothetical protein